MPKGSLNLSYLCIVIAALSLSIGFSLAGFLLGIAVAVVVSITWGVSIWRKWVFGNILCILVILLGISLAVTLGASRLIVLISLLATLSAWDLAAFSIRLSVSNNIADEERIIRTHLLRLVSVLILGLTLPLLAFGLQLDLKFWQVFILGILLLAGLSQVFAQLKRSSND